MDVSLLPDPDNLSHLIGDMLDLKTEIFSGKPVTIKSSGDPVITASYITEDEKLGALCVCDINAANRIGAALTMIPVDIANKNIAEHRIPDEIIDNIKEVMNIISGFLNVPPLPHFKLREVLSSKSSLPEEITALASDPGLRLDMEVNLQNYGQGYMSILLNEFVVAS